MKIKKLDDCVSVSGQINETIVKELAAQGIEMIICNRPDGEEASQPTMTEINAVAKEVDIEFIAIPFASGQINDSHRVALIEALKKNKKTHAYCRTGNRSEQLWRSVKDTLSGKNPMPDNKQYDVVIVGAGSAGIATASSLIKRDKDISIALIDASEVHYYQPGWTLVGGGVFSAESTRRLTERVIPRNATLIKNRVTEFIPLENRVMLDNGASVFYKQLVVAPGLKLNWSAIEGLEETLGKNGVTSNYRYDLAPYTWELVKNLDAGKAIFTQPPMPIKCAGAPQKALYLSASEWFRRGKLKNISIDFYNSGNVLFGVKEYVPTLMKYIDKYHAKLHFLNTLIKVEGHSKTAWFQDSTGKKTSSSFEMLHVCPPQVSPEFVRNSELSDDNGWLDVDPYTLRSLHYPNIWGVGDVLNTTNAKTMAAARKQAPIVAHNVVNTLCGVDTLARYDGYGSCPLTVEHGKIVLAEFSYGGKVTPTFPTWINDGTQPTSFAWHLKTQMLPRLYWQGMLQGREWLASPSY